MRSPLNSSPIFEYPLLIREAHLDTFGHVNNAVYLQLLEEARWEIITENGYGIQKIRESKLGPVILDVHLSFLRELTLRQKIVIHTQMESYEGKICKLRQWISNESKEICAEARFTLALFDIVRRKLIDPTPEWLAALGAKGKTKV